MADPAERESIAKMAGGFLREFGVLYVTFGLLDAQVVEVEHPGTFTAWWFGRMLLISVVSMVFGVFVERRRRR